MLKRLSKKFSVSLDPFQIGRVLNCTLYSLNLATLTAGLISAFGLEVEVVESKQKDFIL